MLLLCVSKLIAFNLENEFSVLTLCLSVLSFCVSSYTRVRLHGWMVVHSKHTGARIDLWLSWSVFTDWLSLVMWCSATHGSSEEFLMCLFLSLFFFLNCRIKIKAIKLIYWHIKLCKQSKISVMCYELSPLELRSCRSDSYQTRCSDFVPTPSGKIQLKFNHQ